jgi:hypothetical protein
MSRERRQHVGGIPPVCLLGQNYSLIYCEVNQFGKGNLQIRKQQCFNGGDGFLKDYTASIITVPLALKGNR